MSVQYRYRHLLIDLNFNDWIWMRRKNEHLTLFLLLSFFLSFFFILVYFRSLLQIAFIEVCHSKNITFRTALKLLRERDIVWIIAFVLFFFFFFKVSFNQKYHVHVINICSLQKYPRSSKKRWKFVSNLFTIKSRFSKIFSKTPRLLLNYTQ